MGIYGHRFDSLIEERNNYLFESTILTEMHISKKDLEDPEILKKVLEKSKKEANDKGNAILIASGLISTACDIVVGIVTGSIVLSLVLFIPFIIGGLILAFKVLMNIKDPEDKNVSKLVSKVKELKSKTEKLKDSPEKDKIIKRCDKILDSVDKHYNKIKSDRKRSENNRIKNHIDTLVKYSKGELPVAGGDIDFIYREYILANKLGIATPDKIDTGCVKCCKDIINNQTKEDKNEYALEYFYGYDNFENALNDKQNESNELQSLAKLIPGFKECDPVFALYAIDDTIIFFNSKDNKFYFCSDYDSKSLLSDSSLYKLCLKVYKKYSWDDSDIVSEEEIEKFKAVYKK